MRHWIFATIIALSPSVGAAEVNWEFAFGHSSASLALEGWQNTSSAGLSWPDGRQAIVTFWLAPLENGTIRCTTYFDTDFQNTGEVCHYALKSGD